MAGTCGVREACRLRARWGNCYFLDDRLGCGGDAFSPPLFDVVAE